MSPNFDFSFGKPVDDDGAGRWIQGSVVCKEDGDGYRFKADLMRRHSSSILQCHSVLLDVPRPFRAGDFAAFLRKISVGEFQTASLLLDLSFPQGLDPTIAGPIWDDMMVWVDPWDHDCLLLLQDLTSLGDQLEQIRKRELLALAFARFSHRAPSAQIGRGPSAPDGGSE